MPLSPDLLTLAALLSIAALVQGFAGYGYGIVAVALLAFLPLPMERLTAVISFTALATLVMLLLLARGHGRIDWRQSGFLLLGCGLGTPLGYGFIAILGDRPVFRWVLGLYLVAAGLHGLRQRTSRPWPEWVALPAGVFSGFLGGAFVTGGPPILLYLYGRAADPRQMEATVQVVFLGCLLLRLLLMRTNASLWEPALLQPTLLICLPILAALALGHYVSRLVPKRRFAIAVNVSIVLLGILVGWQALVDSFT